MLGTRACFQASYSSRDENFGLSSILLISLSPFLAETRQRLTASFLAYIDADTLGYLSHDGLLKSLGPGAEEKYCTACFSGKYPVEFPREDLLQMDLFEKERK